MLSPVAPPSNKIRDLFRLVKKQTKENLQVQVNDYVTEDNSKIN